VDSLAPLAAIACTWVAIAPPAFTRVVFCRERVSLAESFSASSSMMVTLVRNCAPTEPPPSGTSSTTWNTSFSSTMLSSRMVIRKDLSMTPSSKLRRCRVV